MTPRDLEARARFLQVERFARLPADQQRKELPEFYRKLAVGCLNSMFEAILSIYPENILDRRAYANPGGGSTERWARQLQEAAATLSLGQVADQLGSSLWLNVAARARTLAILRQHPEAVAALITEDLAAKDLPSVQRACAAITELRLRQFTRQLLALHLADTPLSPPATTALVWLADPDTIRPLIEEIERNPKSLARHAGLFHGPLAGRPAEPALVKYLDSPDADLRYHAAYALFECRDAALAQPIARLAKDADDRLQSAALTMAQRLPDEAFFAIRPDLVPLISAKADRIRLEAITCFAKRKDLVVGQPILELLKRERMDPGQAVTVMQALNALANSAFGYNLHEWGPAANSAAITRFENWLRLYTGPR